jgi:hypothetical protein
MKKYLPNASITTHAGAVVEVNIDTIYEVKPFTNKNNDVIEMRVMKAHILCV